ncbi:MAG: potassium channel protein [Stanieria sp.]
MNLDWFLICGLGNLGQHCVLALAEFNVKITAIEKKENIHWEIVNIPDLINNLIIGDCRQNNILEQAQVKQCRAALIVTSNEQVNIETALAIRQLNPHTRLVVRSSQTNLNYLLSQQLGNFIAFEPTELPASAFTLAALGSNILGFVDLDGHRIRVCQRQITESDRWCYQRHLYELNSHQRKVIHYRPNSLLTQSSSLHWLPDAMVDYGDTLIYLEVIEKFSPHFLGKVPKKKQFPGNFQLFHPQQLFQQIISFVLSLSIRKVAFAYSAVVFLLLLIGTIVFHWYYPKINFGSAFFATATLLLGGYGDLFGEITDDTEIPWSIKLFSLGLTIAGTVFVGVLYAVLTEALLSSRFEFAKPRFPLPQNNHVVMIGLGRVGQQVINLLQQFQQTVIGITFKPPIQSQYSIPILYGNIQETLSQANLTQAKSVVIVTDDEVLNLEVALMVRTINPLLHLVIRTSGNRSGQHLTKLLPNIQAIGVNRVAAEVFAGAAFGENILSVFRLNQQTILVTEYQIETGDTLNGLLLGDVTYGYDIIPIFYQRSAHSSMFLPSDELKLAIGDRLIILATIEGLRRIEQGQIDLTNKCWQVKIIQALTSDAIFEGANLISRITGCSLTLARQTMKNLPQILPLFLYQPQAQKLVKELQKTLVKATIIMSKQQ